MAVLLLFLGQACRVDPGPKEYLLSGPTMGTTYNIKVVGAPPDGTHEAIEAALEAVNRAMSTYREDSELSRFNRHNTPEPFPLSEDTAAVFRIALQVSEKTGGAFDVTVGPLVNAWGFGPDEEREPPTEAELQALKERVGYRHLTLEDGPALSKARTDLYCDLSAVAKGYGADKVAEVLDAQGIQHYMAEVGGEVRAKGLNLGGQPWRIGIEKPVPDERAVQHVVPLQNMAMATSGDYRNFRVQDGQRLSHTIDPRTGRPIKHGLASVTVLHEQCVWADAYATALMVLGPEEGHRFAENQGIAAYFLIHAPEGFTEKTTAAFVQHTTVK